MLLAHAYTIFAKLPKWTTAWLWNAHIILPVGVFAVAGWSPWLVVSILALSLVTWVGGILQLRRGMRVMGALDLVLALCLALLILQDQILEPIPFQRGALWMGVFIILCASAMKHLHY